MNKSNLLYLIIVLTILIMRISVLLVPEVDVMIFDVIIHNFWFGIILMLIGIFIPNSNVKVLMYGIGAGLVIDQAVFMMLGAGKDKEYWQLPSLIGPAIIMIVIYPIRKKLERFL